MVVIRGVNLYPSALEEVIRTFDHIEEYQVRIDTKVTLIEIKVQIEMISEAKNNSYIVQRQLEEQLRSTFGIHILVEIVSKGSLPRFEFKSQRWVHL